MRVAGGNSSKRFGVLDHLNLHEKKWKIGDKLRSTAIGKSLQRTSTLKVWPFAVTGIGFIIAAMENKLVWSNGEREPKMLLEHLRKSKVRGRVSSQLCS